MNAKAQRGCAATNPTPPGLTPAFAQQKQFTADASHELRTPLAVMISEAQTSLTRNRSEAEYRETIATFLDTAQQMRQLTESLLELARHPCCHRYRPRHRAGEYAASLRAFLSR